MKYATPEQIKAISTLLSKNNLNDEKDSIVSAFSGGRTKSRKELKFNEAAALIGHFKSLDLTDKRSDKMRNKILSMAHEVNWTIKGYVDMDRINNWCIKFGHAHKKLDFYTYEELPKLVTQFEEVYREYLSKV